MRKSGNAAAKARQPAPIYLLILFNDPLFSVCVTLRSDVYLDCVQMKTAHQFVRINQSISTKTFFVRCLESVCPFPLSPVLIRCFPLPSASRPPLPSSARVFARSRIVVIILHSNRFGSAATLIVRCVLCMYYIPIPAYRRKR